MMKDIGTMDDIRLLVDSFYGKIRSDELLAEIFNGKIKDQWPKHLERMCLFWQTVLLNEHTYQGSPFVPHAKLTVDQKHFQRWVKLFENTVDELFKGENATKAKWQGERMAEMFHSKIEFYKNNLASPIL